MSSTISNTIDPSLSHHYDIVVCGLGVAACLLIRELARVEQLEHHSILIIEPSSSHTSKSICFWAHPDDSIVADNFDIIARTWSRIQVPPLSVEVVEPLRYYQFHSHQLYLSTLRLCQLHGVKIVQGFVDSLQSSDDKVQIHSTTGIFWAHKVFDSRYIASDSTSDDSMELLQTFYGAFVELEQPLFDEDTVTLMDFSVRQDGATQFMYVLPDSPTRALVEFTRFGTEPIDVDKAKQYIDSYIQDKWGEYQTLDSEQGRIPMAFPSERLQIEGVTYIGTRGGAVKPSTGYAFQTMFQHAKDMCKNIGINRMVQIKVLKRFQFYDRLLIDILIHRPNLGVPIFRRLFETQRVSTVFTFLQQQTTLWQEAKIFMGLQWRPFLGSLFKYIRSYCSRIRELQLMWLTMLVVVVYALSPELTNIAATAILAAGMLAVGIPHGALDHRIAGKAGVSRWDLNFHIRYWSMIAGMALIWFASSMVGLSIFVLTSAWHFGQTDFHEWKLDEVSPWISCFWGALVLLFIITSHAVESHLVLNGLGVSVGPTLEQVASSGMPLLMLPMLLMGLAFKSGSMVMTICTLLLTTQLSLPVAFGLYFLGQHSLEAWSHLAQEHTIMESQKEMWIEALPFTLGALIVLGLTMLNPFGIQLKAGWLIIAGSCITLPHIVYMHAFYQRQIRCTKSAESAEDLTVLNSVHVS